MIGAQHVDRFGKTALEFVLEVGNIGSEIGVGAVGFFQGPVGVIAEIACAKQCLLTVFPIVWHLPLRRRQRSFVDQPLVPERFEHVIDLGTVTLAPVMQGSFGIEHFVLDTECCKVLPDQFEHRGNRPFLHQRQPFAFLHIGKRRSKFGLQLLADWFQVVPWIKSCRDLANVLAKRLAVPQEGTARQRVDLRAGIVDVIFLDHIISGKRQYVRQGVADDRTADVTDMHGACRIGGNVFNVDLRSR